MYLDHFCLREFPFRITPDPEFLFWTEDHHRAFALLSQVARDERAVAVILGEPGTGKTTLLQHFVATRPKDVHVGMISNYSSGLGGLWHWLYRAFDLHAEGTDEKLREAFEAQLLARHHKSVRSMLIVDEAQNVSDEDLATLTGLTERSDVLSMRLVLVGQTRLRRRLLATHTRTEGGDGVPLQIGPMSSAEVTGYIRHRMAVSGCPDAVFDDEAMERIAQLAVGVPRLVNVLCELLLISAFNVDGRKIGPALVDHVLRDVRQAGMLGHLLPSPARPAYGATMAKPVPPRASPASPAPAGVGTPPSPEPTTLREPAQTETRLIPANLPALPDTLHEIAVPPVEADQRCNGRIGLPVFAAGVAAAAVALAVLPTYLTAPLETVAEVQQDEASDTQAPPAGTAVPAHVGPALPAPALLQGGDALTLRNQALNVGARDSLTAAIGFARAALRGDARAAYYLGQHMEVGDGVPRNAALAAAWYELASQTQRSARRALQNLSDTAKATGQFPDASPRPLMGIIGADQLAEFVWAAPDDAAMRYLIELAEDTDAPPQQYGPFDLSAAVLEPATPARIWRVVSLNSEGVQISASSWHLIAAAP